MQLLFFQDELLKETICDKQMEVVGKNRSVMPFDVLGCTRATLIKSTSLQPFPKGMGNLLKLYRDGDRRLQLFFLNEECLVIVVHQTAVITSLPFVHTARRSYRLNCPMKFLDYGFCLTTSSLVVTPVKS